MSSLVRGGSSLFSFFNRSILITQFWNPGLKYIYLQLYWHLLNKNRYKFQSFFISLGVVDKFVFNALKLKQLFAIKNISNNHYKLKYPLKLV